VSRSDIGFNSDNNAVNVYWPEGQCQFDVMNKQILARELIGLVANHFRPDSSQ
jgi:phosphopantothenoylcysteine decarboxylase/phosphopantothenate--cysteine ligase